MQVLEFPRWDECWWTDEPATNSDPNLQWSWIGYQATFRLTTKDDESFTGFQMGFIAVRISKLELTGSSPWDYQGKSRSGGLGRGYLVVGCCGKRLGSCHDLIKLTTDAFASLVWFSWIFGAKNIRVWLSFGSLLFFTDFLLCSYSWFLCRAILSSPRTSSIRLSALEATRIGKPMVLLWARTAVVLATVLQDSSARAHKWNTTLDRDQRYIYIDWLRQQSNLTLAFVILSWSMLRMWCMTPPGKGKCCSALLSRLAMFWMFWISCNLELLSSTMTNTSREQHLHQSETRWYHSMYWFLIVPY